MNTSRLISWCFDFNFIITYTLNLDSKKICSEIPSDAIPISSMQGNYFFIHKAFFNKPHSPFKFNSLQHPIVALPQWKQLRINNYNGPNLDSSLAAAIQMKENNSLR